MSTILYVYFAIVILLFNTNTICEQTSDTDYDEDGLQDNLNDASNYLENRVDLDDNMEEHSNNVEHKAADNTGPEDGGIIEKLKGVWNKILHPNNYDRATYTDTLNNLHDEIFKYLNEDKMPRSVQPVNMQCQTTCNSTLPIPTTAPKFNPNSTTSECSTYLKNFTVSQLNYLKKFLKCMQNQPNSNKTSSTNAEPTKTTEKPGCSKCGTTSNSTTKKPATTHAAKGIAAKPKPESGTHSHNLSANHSGLDDEGKKKSEPLDLNAIQKIIDEAKDNLQMANESLNTCKRMDESITPMGLPTSDIMFPFFNPYYMRKKRNFVDKKNSEDFQLNQVVSDVVAELRENDKDAILGNNDYSKILGIRKTKKKKKKKKSRKKKGKNYRENEEGAETAGKMPMNVNISNSLNNFNTDYNNLKFKVTPEQEEDINKFLKNINEPPQLFNFDIERYLNPNLIERNLDPPNVKSFYEFDDAEHHPHKRKPGQFYIFNQGEANEPTSSFKQKRDILTQRIKAISNKMKMDSFLAQPREYFEDTSKVSRSSPPVNLDQFKSDNDFVDKFYLLNDGNPNSMVYKTDTHRELDKINPIDLRIDLDLDKKFRDLKWETDRKFYSDVIPESDIQKKRVPPDTKNSEGIKNDDFIFYK